LWLYQKLREIVAVVMGMMAMKTVGFRNGWKPAVK
jgi:hypothetical protein